jgi:hypothetical protein
MIAATVASDDLITALGGISGVSVVVNLDCRGRTSMDCRGLSNERESDDGGGADQLEKTMTQDRPGSFPHAYTPFNESSGGQIPTSIRVVY